MNTNTKHTPGPWQLEDHGNSSRIETVAGKPIGGAWESDDCFGNARLMAAAPEMLAALVAVFQARAPQFNFDFASAPDMQMLAAAIAKARGDK